MKIFLDAFLLSCACFLVVSPLFLLLSLVLFHGAWGFVEEPTRGNLTHEYRAHCNFFADANFPSPSNKKQQYLSAVGIKDNFYSMVCMTIST